MRGYAEVGKTYLKPVKLPSQPASYWYSQSAPLPPPPWSITTAVSYADASFPPVTAVTASGPTE